MNSLKGFFYGIATSVTFGLIPLFTLPLMQKGMVFDSILFYRIFSAVSQHTKRISKASNAFIYNRVKQKRYPLPSTGKHWNF